MMSFARSGIVPPPLSAPPGGRYSNDNDNTAVTALANKVPADDDAIEHRCEELGDMYSACQIQLYDFLNRVCAKLDWAEDDAKSSVSCARRSPSGTGLA